MEVLQLTESPDWILPGRTRLRSVASTPARRRHWLRKARFLCEMVFLCLAKFDLDFSACDLLGFHFINDDSFQSAYGVVIPILTFGIKVI